MDIIQGENGSGWNAGCEEDADEVGYASQMGLSIMIEARLRIERLLYCRQDDNDIVRNAAVREYEP